MILDFDGTGTEFSARHATKGRVSDLPSRTWILFDGLFVALNLAIESILFAIQLMLLTLRDVSAIEARVGLFLRSDRPIFSHQLSVVPVEIASISHNALVQAIVSAKHFCSSRMFCAPVSACIRRGEST